MKLTRVRPSVCLSVRPIIRLPYSAAAGLLCGPGGQERSTDCCTAGAEAASSVTLSTIAIRGPVVTATTDRVTGNPAKRHRPSATSDD